MERSNRSRLALGLILILLGAWFLAIQVFPQLQAWVNITLSWPFIIIGVGILILLIGLLTNVPSMAIPASVISGVGSLLYWQNTTGNWESWAYTWTLIPGFVGVGILIAGLLGDPEMRDLRAGLRLILISAILFFVFGSFLGGFTILGPYWPVLLIIAGLFVLLTNLARKRQ
jgi:hypothetical protein